MQSYSQEGPNFLKYLPQLLNLQYLPKISPFMERTFVLPFFIVHSEEFLAKTNLQNHLTSQLIILKPLSSLVNVICYNCGLNYSFNFSQDGKSTSYEQCKATYGADTRATCWPEVRLLLFLVGSVSFRGHANHFFIAHFYRRRPTSLFIAQLLS